MASGSFNEQINYLNSPKRLTDDEWNWLVQSGSHDVQNMITHFTRIPNNLDLQGIWDWLTINATDLYYIKAHYQYATIYFIGAIDKDNFDRMYKNVSSQK